MKLIKTDTGEIFKGEIEKLKKEEVQKLKGNANFSFDWSREAANDVYKIKRKNENETLGLISLIDIPKEKRIHINLLESSKENVGKDKKFANIVGNLLGFACKTAFQKGYDGFVSLVPKSMLVVHYMSYGFVKVGNCLAIFMKAAESLKSKYHNDEEI